ncbi:MAG TPA: Nif3-like dinuclear metal center hexameric protein [Gemmatimonadaceae bacterium]|nr:Nif3-like dinuclear metal center hexameric protein [Gemmatimonadaceae bacterium]
MSVPRTTAGAARTTHVAAVAEYLDQLLGIPAAPDYPGALNGLQIECRGEVRAIAAAVDLSQRTITGAAQAGANLLLVHHGMFWGGAQHIRGAQYVRLRTLLEHDIAVYSAHLPLDAHPELGNNVLLARQLGLVPTGGFARHQTLTIGVRGEATQLRTEELLARADAFAREHGGHAIATAFGAGRMTRHWAICTGGGASVETLREARETGVDTLIVGEGPHWTAVDAPESGLTIIYAGHYATETLGVQALARQAADTFGLPWTFVPAPTGL